MEPVFLHLLIFMMVAWTAAMMLRWVGIPIIMGELLIGVILGPAVLGWVMRPGLLPKFFKLIF